MQYYISFLIKDIFFWFEEDGNVVLFLRLTFNKKDCMVNSNSQTFKLSTIFLSKERIKCIDTLLPYTMKDILDDPLVLIFW